MLHSMFLFSIFFRTWLSIREWPHVARDDIRSFLVSSMTKSTYGQSEPVSIQLARCRAFIFLDFCAVVCLEGTFRPSSSLFFSSTIALLKNKPAGPTYFYASDAAVLFHFAISVIHFHKFITFTNAISIRYIYRINL